MSSSSKISPMISKKKVSFFREVQNEFRKITWTTKSELLSLTKVVLISTFIGSLGIYVADLLVRGALGMISFLIRTVFG